jgi:tetratricopeptide (TPR) repeat protein
VAFAPNAGILQLYDVATDRVVANLTQPERMWYWSLAASRDGRRLAYTTNDEMYLGMWDLAELSSDLEDLGLSMAEPLSKMLSKRGEASSGTPVLFTIERGDALPDRSRWSENWLNLADREILAGRPPDAIGNAELMVRVFTARAEYHWLNGNLQAARTDWQRALELTPDSSDSTLALARSYVLCRPDQSDAKRGASLVAPLLFGETPHEQARTLLGIAQFRLGNASAAAASLRESLAAREDVLARYFLTLSLLKLGQIEEAERELDAGKQAHVLLMRAALRRQHDDARREAVEALAKARADNSQAH